MGSQPIRLAILDIDGVLTNGKKLYGIDGSVMGKEFCDRDFSAIKEFKASGIQVVFLSGDRVVNARMAEHRKIPFYSSRLASGELCKRKAAEQIFRDTGIGPDQTLFVGDDLFDVGLAEHVAFSTCPSDAHLSLRTICSFVLPTASGQGCLQSLLEVLNSRGLFHYPAIADVVALDSQELVSYG